MKALILVIAILVSIAGASAATITVAPVSGTVPVGGTVNVNVGTSDVTDLYAYQFDLAFNSAVVSAASETEGSFLSSRGSTFFVPGTIDNAAGMITFTANTLLGPGSGASGTGSLATVRFTGLSAGTSTITPSNVILLDSTGTDIVATAQGGAIAVNTSAIPEPGSGLLILSGLTIGLELLRRGKAKS